MPHVEQWLAEYHDHELTPRRRKRVEQHLAGCPGCLTKLREMQRLSSVLARHELPDNLTNAVAFQSRVMLRLPRRRGRQARPISWAWFAVPVSLVCALVVVQGLWFALYSLGTFARVAEWSRVGTSTISAPLAGMVSGWGPTLDYVMGSPLRDVVQLGGFASLYLLLLVVFVLYAGWVGVLVRSVQRVSVREGEQDGSL